MKAKPTSTSLLPEGVVVSRRDRWRATVQLPLGLNASCLPASGSEVKFLASEGTMLATTVGKRLNETTWTAVDGLRLRMSTDGDFFVEKV